MVEGEHTTKKRSVLDMSALEGENCGDADGVELKRRGSGHTIITGMDENLGSKKPINMSKG